MRNQKGFSLIELVVVMSILSTLVFVASSVYKPAVDLSKETVLITNAGKIATMLEIALEGSGVIDEVTAGTFLTANIDDMITSADIVNVWAENKYYQTTNGSEIGDVMVTLDPAEPYYFEVTGNAGFMIYLPLPKLRVRW